MNEPIMYAGIEIPVVVAEVCPTCKARLRDAATGLFEVHIRSIMGCVILRGTKP